MNGKDWGHSGTGRSQALHKGGVWGKDWSLIGWRWARPEDAETYRRVRARGRLGERLARRFVEKRTLMERKSEMGLDAHTHIHTCHMQDSETHTNTEDNTHTHTNRDRWETCHREVRSQFTQKWKHTSWLSHANVWGCVTGSDTEMINIDEACSPFWPFTF